MRFLPIARWSDEFSAPGALRADLLAGLTGAVVVLPQGIAFATLAGMPPEYGLYAAIVPCMIAAVFGSSRAMVTGPANAISLTTMALIAPLAAVESAQYIALVLTLSFLVGILQCAMGLAGAGKLVEKVPHSVIVGFTVGAAILIINSQLGMLLGLSLGRGLGVVDSVAMAAHEISRGAINWFSPLLAGLTMIAIMVWRPFNRIVPAMLVGVIAGSSAALLIESLMVGSVKYERVAAIEAALPPFSVPDLGLSTIRDLFGPALIMVLLASAEAMAIARSVALRCKDKFDANQEFIGQGLANIGGAFFSSYPASGSFNRSGVNVSAGAKTPLSAVSAAIFLVLILVFIGPMIEYLPKVVISAILLAVAWGLIDLRQIRHEINAGPVEYLPMLITALGTVFVSLEWAIVAGVCLAAILKRLIGSRRSHD